jgi:hypothetical protein
MAQELSSLRPCLRSRRAKVAGRGRSGLRQCICSHCRRECTRAAATGFVHGRDHWQAAGFWDGTELAVWGGRHGTVVRNGDPRPERGSKSTRATHEPVCRELSPGQERELAVDASGIPCALHMARADARMLPLWRWSQVGVDKGGTTGSVGKPRGVMISSFCSRPRWRQV